MVTKDSPASKPGLKTTEFWLSAASMVVAFLVSNNVAPDGSVWAQALSIGAILLAALGYTAGRSIVKREQIKASSGTQ